jgi:hypothetical protein
LLAVGAVVISCLRARADYDVQIVNDGSNSRLLARSMSQRLRWCRTLNTNGWPIFTGTTEQ